MALCHAVAARLQWANWEYARSDCGWRRIVAPCPTARGKRRMRAGHIAGARARAYTDGVPRCVHAIADCAHAMMRTALHQDTPRLRCHAVARVQRAARAPLAPTNWVATRLHRTSTMQHGLPHHRNTAQPVLGELQHLGAPTGGAHASATMRAQPICPPRAGCGRIRPDAWGRHTNPNLSPGNHTPLPKLPGVHAREPSPNRHTR